MLEETIMPILQNQVQYPIFDVTGSWWLFKKQFDARNGVRPTVSIKDDVCNHLLVYKIEQRYGEEHLQYRFRSQLRVRSQRQNETLHELESDIEDLVTQNLTAAADMVEECIIGKDFLTSHRDMIDICNRIFRLGSQRIWIYNVAWTLPTVN